MGSQDSFSHETFQNLLGFIWNSPKWWRWLWGESCDPRWPEWARIKTGKQRLPQPLFGWRTCFKLSWIAWRESASELDKTFIHTMCLPTLATYLYLETLLITSRRGPSPIKVMKDRHRTRGWAAVSDSCTKTKTWLAMEPSISMYGASQEAQKYSICLQCRRRKRHGFDPWVGKIPCRRNWQPIPVFLPEKSHGQRSLAGHSLWGHKESDTTECVHTCARMHIHTCTHLSVYPPMSKFILKSQCLWAFLSLRKFIT